MSTQAVPQVHVQLTQWQNNHEINTAAANNLMNDFQTQYENGEISQQECKDAQGCVWDIYNERTTELGFGYNFMGENDASDTEAYQSQLGLLAQGEMASKDRDGDGKLSKTEFILGEVYGGATALTAEEKAQAATMASLMFDAIDSLVLVDSNPDNDELNESLDLKDLENYYKTLDGFNYDEATQEMAFNGDFNGDLDLDSFSAFLDTATASVTQEQINEMNDAYLEIFEKVSQ